MRTFLFLVLFLISANLSVFGCQLYYASMSGSQTAVINQQITYTVTPLSGPFCSTYDWDVTGGQIMGQSQSSVTVKWTSSGTYTVKYYGGLVMSPSASRQVTVAAACPPGAPPTPSASPTACGAKTLTRGTPPSGVTFYWQGTNSSGTSTSNSSLTYQTTGTKGTYTYYLRARDNTQGCWSSAVGKTVTIGGTPAQPTTSGYTSNCGPAEISLSAVSTQSDVTGHKWYTSSGGSTLVSGVVDASGGSGYLITEVTKTFSSTTTYYVAAENSCGQSTRKSVTATVNAAPTVSINASATPNNVCTLDTDFHLTASSGTSYQWKKNGATISGATSQTYYPVTEGSGTGSYTVRVGTTSCGVIESSAIPVTINTSPAAAVIGPSSGCGSVNLEASTGTGYSWVWKNSGGTTVGTSPSYNVTSSGSYHVITTLNNCSNTSSAKSVTVNAVPSNPVSMVSAARCGSGSITVGGTPGSNGNSLKWYAANSGGSALYTGTAYSPSISVTKTYYASTYNTTTGCESTGTRPGAIATVNSIPSAPSSVTNNARCGTGSITVSGTPGTNGNSLKWYTASSGGSAFRTATSYSPSISSTKTYYISTYNTGTTCESSSRVGVTATVNAIPTVNAGTDKFYFNDNNSSSLSGSPSGGSWSGTGVASGSFVPTTVSPGSYTLTYSYTDGNSCSNTDQLVATVYGVPSANIAGSTYLSRGETSGITVSGAYDSYQWYQDGTLISGASSQTYTADAAGEYKARVFKNNADTYTAPLRLYNSIDQAADMNYVITHNILEEGITERLQLDELTVGQLTEQIQYVDGLGRPIQTVTTQGSYNGHDIVQPIVYDQFGRDSVQYLPYVSGSQSGLYITDATDNQLLFYDGRTDKVANDSKPYAIKIFEDSPLNRVLEQGAPGVHWQPSTGHSVKMSYETNGVGEVRSFDIQSNSIEPTSNALEFDGSDDYVALNMYYNQQGVFLELTFEAWVNTTFSSSTWSDNWSIIDFDRSEFFNVCVKADDGKVGFATYATSGEINDMTGTSVVNDGKWHHIAAVYDGTDKIIYVDGVEDARIVNPHSGVGIGKNITRYGFVGDGSEATSFNATRNNIYYDGKIGELKFWDVARSPGQIQSDAYTSPSSTESGLLAWWKMDDSVGSNTLTDHSGNGNTGTLYNMDLNNCWVTESNQYYAPNMLSVTKTLDEQNNAVKEYKDKLGNVVLKRVYLSATDSLDTYYIYDDFNNLRLVLPPEAIKNFDANYNTDPQQFLDNWAFRYSYDARKRMIEKKVPGAEPVYMVYDKRDRLVLTQDGNQRDGNAKGSDKDWMFTKYDDLNRPILTGIYTHTSKIDQDSMQSYVNSQFAGGTYSEQRGGSVHGYTNNAFPQISNESQYLSVTYYDDYDFITDQSSVWGTEYNFIDNYGEYDVNILSKVKRQVTGSKTKVLDENKWIKSVSYYDRKYRVVQAAASNLADHVDRVFTKYDFTGKPVKSKLIHKGPEGDDKTTEDSLSYDHAGRQIDHYMSLSDGTISTGSVLISRNEYNELGELIDKKLHSTNQGASFKQSVDYAYNIRGWLTKINESDLSQQDAGDPTDYFGMELAYNTNNGTGATPMYNGNISSMKWSNFGNPDNIVERAYNYSYDHINRIKSADHKMKTGTWIDAGDTLNTDYSYDYNGNIQSLNRRDIFADPMDGLSYNYGSGIDKSNRLLSVTDTGDITKGFKDGNTSGNDYDYDANGNMIKDLNKGIQKITYNYLNLPDTVDTGDDKLIVYSYDASGMKLRQSITENGAAIKTTDYMGGFIYEDDQMQLAQHPEGRIVPRYDTNGNRNAYVYDYHIKDHLGNVRLTFTTDPSEDIYAATLEDATEQQERADFHPSYDSISRISFNLYDHTDNGSSSYSLRLDGQPNRIIGLAKSLQVLPGDTVTMETFGKYLAATSNNNNLTANMLPALMGAFGLTAGVTGELLDAYNAVDGLFGTGPLIGSGDWEDDNAPKAYLNYILFDRNFVAYDMGIDQIDIDAYEDGSDVPHDRMYLEAYATKPGYIYVYLSNENPKQLEVYFDDLTISHRHIDVIQTDDYYPFGLAINGLSGRSENKTENKFLYNGKELQADLDLDWYDYGARMYMPELGRFTTIDPLADKFAVQSPFVYAANNPIRFEDFQGKGPRDKISGPFSSNNVIKRKNGQVFARRFTTSERKSMNMSMGLVSTLPATRIAGTMVGIAYEGMKGMSGKDNSFFGATATAGSVEFGKAFFDAASKDSNIQAVGFEGAMKGWKTGVGVAGTGLGVYSLTKEAFSDATPQEIMENYTFQIAVAGDLGNLNISNEGVLEFSNDNLTVDQASNVLNLVYSSVSSALSNFDLSNADDVKGATAYLRDNLASIIKDINRQMNERDEDSD